MKLRVRQYRKTVIDSSLTTGLRGMRREDKVYEFSVGKTALFIAGGSKSSPLICLDTQWLRGALIMRGKAVLI